MKRGLSFLSIMVLVLGATYARTIGVSLSYSPNMEFPQRLVEAFVKYAEFLTDTRTMVSAFGIRLSCEYRTGGCI